jgi:hypothetical protein
MTGSTIMDLTLPDSGVIETLKLNNKLGAITASNLNKITTFEAEDGYENTLKTIKVSNCPALDNYTYNCAKADTTKTYSIIGFIWQINDADDLEFDENDKVIGIVALNSLAEGTPANGSSVTDLIGTI